MTAGTAQPGVAEETELWNAARFWEATEERTAAELLHAKERLADGSVVTAEAMSAARAEVARLKDELASAQDLRASLAARLEELHSNGLRQTFAQRRQNVAGLWTTWRGHQTAVKGLVEQLRDLEGGLPVEWPPAGRIAGVPAQTPSLDKLNAAQAADLVICRDEVAAFGRSCVVRSGLTDGETRTVYLLVLKAGVSIWATVSEKTAITPFQLLVDGTSVASYNADHAPDWRTYTVPADAVVTLTGENCSFVDNPAGHA